MHYQTKGESMAKEDRKQLVLDILIESDLALPKAAIFRNLKVRGATFERRSVDNYLSELAEEGLVRKVDVEALESGEIVETDMSESGYFIATELGYQKRGESSNFARKHANTK